MSYILDALRKADAERERGAVPDLHAQLLPPGSLPDEAEGAASPAWRWWGLGAGLIVLAGLGWLFLGRDAAPPPGALAPPPAVPAPPPAETATPTQALPPVPASAPASTAEVTATAAAPSASAGEPAAAAAAPEPPAKPRPAARTATVTAPKVGKAEKAEKSEKAAATAPAEVAKAGTTPPKTEPATRTTGAAVPKAEAPKTSATAASTEAPAPAAGTTARLPSLGDLPPELRQMVPPLAIGGSVYSPQPTARMVVINGQVFQEGSALGSELRLEQIRQKTAVLSIRGTRFEVPL